MTMQAQREPNPASGQMPVIFAAHGVPILLDDAVWLMALVRRPPSLIFIVELRKLGLHEAAKKSPGRYA